jgi:alginate O-acetyltransferase complex protein AlgI
MLFHTWVFFAFIAIVYPVFLLVRKNNLLMNVWLMIASYVFYGSWWWPYVILLFSTSAVDYLMVLLMERNQRTRKLWLIISLVSNFGFLGFFKYAYFMTNNVNGLFDWLGMPWHFPDPAAYPNAFLALVDAPEDWLIKNVVLPIGISFHTFQSMSYTIDAYWGKIETERSFIRCNRSSPQVGARRNSLSSESLLRV